MKKLFLLVTIMAIVSSCFQAPQSSRNSSSGSSDESNVTEPNEPDFGSSSLNYFQNGSSQIQSALTLPYDFDNSFILRGESVHSFIVDGRTLEKQCLFFRFQSATNQLLILTASPRFFYNFDTKTQEYYYVMESENSTLNKSFCQTAGLITELNTRFPTETFSYAFSEVCSGCTTTNSSDPVEILTTSGASIDVVPLNHLSLVLNNDSTTTSPTLGCTSSTECTNKGFDCCSNGQCVNDGAVKDGVNTTSTEYLQSVLDIQTNPANVSNYPQFYHICGTIIDDDEDEDEIDPDDELSERLTELKELYECTNLVEGELSYCTKTISDLSSFTGTVESGADDRSFSNTYSGTATLPTTNIETVTYAGETLLSNYTVVSGVTVGAINDTLTDTTTLTVTHTPASNAPNDDLKIRYQIDGSCEKVSTSVAKCQKFYTQGQNTGKITDHFPASNNFMLPLYADTSKSISVRVDGINKFVGSDWSLSLTSPAEVQFSGTGLQVFDTQVVELTFFVDTTVNNVLQSKQDAQDSIDTICSCGALDCSLEEVLDGSNNVIDYSCVYPQPDNSEAPLQQTVFVSSKNVPVRFYDTLGVAQSKIDSDTLAQEGNLFEYTDDNTSKPNNVSSDIGFNEIYGSLSSDPGAAQPALEVDVEKGKTYDIYAESGSFSTCFTCGTDYYSNLAKIFPDNFLFKGGGYRPEDDVTDKRSTNQYRADDLLFGRACFLPASMIPWSHTENSDRQTQRLRRMATQHFYFANGYQRDWYGFDYASLIGSFDGVRWFAIGNQRRIKAETNKLFLAVNAYFGDLNSDSSYKVVVSDIASLPSVGTIIESDFESDGAECQQYHTCDTDQDCAAQLGWEYSCQDIATWSTSWPMFDENGQEIPDTSSVRSILDIIGGGGGNKRCVYRGRGATCTPQYDSVNSTTAFNSVSSFGLHSCNSNTYCQAFIDSTPQLKFNTKISRYPLSVATQNNSSTIPESDLDTFGLGARILGRPYLYEGTSQIPTDALSNSLNNNVSAICIPGRSPENDTLLNANSNVPVSTFNGDKVNGMGMTPSNTLDDHYLSSCSIFDSDGNYYQNESGNSSKSLDDSELVELASSQAIPTNALQLLESLTNEDLVKNFDSEQITEVMYEENRCLRAPGQACFSNFDCAPNDVIANVVKGVSAEDTSLHSILNKYEILFWQEDLICSQEDSPGTEDFEVKNNKCCRETGKDVTIGTLVNQSGFAANLASDVAPVFDNTNIPSTGLNLSSANRYSRLATVHSEMNSTPSQYPALASARADICTLGSGCVNSNTLTNQWKTFSTIADRTCCSSNWIRNFHEENGGGHSWGPGKTQQIDKTNFRCLNWAVSNDDFSCEHTSTPDDPACFAKSVTSTKANQVMKWMSTLEMLGIPQLAVMSEDFSDIECSVDPTNQNATGTGIPIPGMIQFGSDGEYISGADKMYGADDSTNFDGDLKQIFSADTISCCLPAGTVLPSGSGSDQCCSGFVNGLTNTCALPDYTNISLYLNRFISSEAKDLSTSLFDADTGYLNSPNDAVSLACNQNMCASGFVALGVAHSDLKVKGHESNQFQLKRFIDGNDQSNNFSGLSDIFDQGLRWNVHAYCVPQALGQGQAVLDVFDCSNF